MRRSIEKSFYDRREELRQALYRIDGAINRYKQTGEKAEIGTIAIELRGLLCVDEGFFLRLAAERGATLEVYTYEPPFITDELNDNLKSGLTHAYRADCVSLTCEKPCTRKTTVQEWLNMPVAEIKGARCTPRRLIEETANTLGPAHYGTHISSAMGEMKTIEIGGVPSYFRTLFKFAEILLELGKRFLQTF